MKKQMKLWIFAAAFVALLAGASLLYRSLGDKEKENLYFSGEDEKTKPTQTDESEPNDSKNDDTKKDEDAADDTKPLEAAKDITVTDIDGNEVSLSDFLGKPVVLNFWASWCGICKNEMMDFELVYNQYKEDIVFMMVDATDGSRETVKKGSLYIEKKGYTFPVYYDTKQEGYFAYNTSAVPATYFIDAEGNIVKKIKGGVDRVILERYIEMIQ